MLGASEANLPMVPQQAMMSQASEAPSSPQVKESSAKCPPSSLIKPPITKAVQPVSKASKSEPAAKKAKATVIIPVKLEGPADGPSSSA